MWLSEYSALKEAFEINYFWQIYFPAKGQKDTTTTQKSSCNAHF